MHLRAWRWRRDIWPEARFETRVPICPRASERVVSHIWCRLRGPEKSPERQALSDCSPLAVARSCQAAFRASCSSRRERRTAAASGGPPRAPRSLSPGRAARAARPRGARAAAPERPPQTRHDPEPDGASRWGKHSRPLELITRILASMLFCGLECCDVTDAETGRQRATVEHELPGAQADNCPHLVARTVPRASSRRKRFPQVRRRRRAPSLSTCEARAAVTSFPVPSSLRGKRRQRLASRRLF